MRRKYDKVAFSERRWKDFLLSLSNGSYEMDFENVNQIESMKATGTRLNAYGIYNRVYKFSPRYKELKCIINVISTE